MCVYVCMYVCIYNCNVIHRIGVMKKGKRARCDYHVGKRSQCDYHVGKRARCDYHVGKRARCDYHAGKRARCDYHVFCLLCVLYAGTYVYRRYTYIHTYIYTAKFKENINLSY